MSEESGAGAAAEPVRDPVGRGLSFMALMVALLALGASAYVFYRAVWSTADGNLASELSDVRNDALEANRELEARLEGVESALAALPSRTTEGGPTPDASSLQEELNRRFDAERARIDASVERLQSALGSALAAKPPTTIEWKLAEAEYLLRVGNHRVLMERDARGAVPLFRAADDVVKDVDDAGLVPVRAKLAEEISALDSVEQPDIDGQFVRLEVLKRRIRELPLRLPDYKRDLEEAGARSPTTAAEPSEPTSWLGRVADRLFSLVRIRDHSSGGLKPLLDPVEAGYLEMNLELALERAQLALLRDDPTLYQASLDAARRLIEDHLDAQSEVAMQFRAELDAAGQTKLGAPLPDVSGSLRLLRETSRGILHRDVSPIEDDAAGTAP
jgi:uroporphyrin-3 C-methyltransferase